MVNGQSVSWLGHLEKMEKDRLSRKVSTQELEGTRGRGRPRKDGKRESSNLFWKTN